MLVLAFNFREEGPTALTETVKWPDAMTTEKVLSKDLEGRHVWALG